MGFGKYTNEELSNQQELPLMSANWQAENVILLFFKTWADQIQLEIPPQGQEVRDKTLQAASQKLTSWRSSQQQACTNHAPLKRKSRNQKFATKAAIVVNPAGRNTTTPGKSLSTPQQYEDTGSGGRCREAKSHGIVPFQKESERTLRKGATPPTHNHNGPYGTCRNVHVFIATALTA